MKMLFFKPMNKAISAVKFNGDEIIKMYQLKQMDLSRQLHDQDKSTLKDVMIKNITISHSGVEKIQESLYRFRSEINSIKLNYENEEECVYQFTTALLPYTRNNIK